MTSFSPSLNINFCYIQKLICNSPIHTLKMLLESTTLLHLSAILFPTECYPPKLDAYPLVISISIFLSVLWHLTGEEVPLFTVLNMTFAGFWFILDFHHAMKFHSNTVLIQVLYLNISVAFIHIVFELSKLRGTIIHNYMPPLNRRHYILQHSIWHILSAAKSVAVMMLLHCDSHQVR